MSDCTRGLEEVALTWNVLTKQTLFWASRPAASSAACGPTGKETTLQSETAATIHAIDKRLETTRTRNEASSCRLWLGRIWKTCIRQF